MRFIRCVFTVASPTGEVDVLPAEEVGRRSAELVLRTLERIGAR